MGVGGASRGWSLGEWGWVGLAEGGHWVSGGGWSLGEWGWVGLAEGGHWASGGGWG